MLAEPNVLNINTQREEVCCGEGDEDFVLDAVYYTGVPWRDGCVVVDLNVLFNALTCQECSLPLEPRKCLGLHPDDITGYIYISCSNPACNKINRIPLGKTHRHAETGPLIFYVNSKLPLGS